MGIRYLTNSLRPYAEPCLLDGTPRIVIDGPSLAYHITYLCTPKRGASTPFTQPSYALLASAVLAWLDELELHGATIAAIYFDGHLPHWKIPERLQRSLQVFRQLNQFCLSTPKGVPDEAQVQQPTSVDLFPKAKPTSSPSGSPLPVPSFAVQVICEALRQSDRYGPITKLVPEEADCYCADSVRLGGGGTVLTSDSDLLVFDLGPQGSVVFLHDIEPVAVSGSQGLAALNFSPTKIAEKLSLPHDYGLSAFAFELTTDPYLKSAKLLSRSKDAAAIGENPEGYESFMETYRFHPLEPSSPRPTVTDAETADMDSKVSELIVQFLSQDTPVDVLDPAMFLPPVVDCWARTTAWDMSTDIRRLAYCILRHISKTRAAELEVREYRRMITATSRGTAVSVPSSGTLSDACAELASLIAKIQSGLDQPDLCWIVLSLCQDLKSSAAAGKEPLTLQILTQATTTDGTLVDVTSWDAIHFVAQIHTTYYSLRMLRQMLQFCQKRQPNDLPESLSELSALLSHLPPLVAMPSVHEIADLPLRLKLSGGLDVLRAVSRLSGPVVLGSALPSRRKKKQKQKISQNEASKSTKKGSATKSNNSRHQFSLLNSLRAE